MAERKNDIPAFFEALKETASRARFEIRVSEQGRVISVGDGIAHVSGLKNTKLYELIRFEGEDEGIAFDLAPESIGVIMLTERNGIRAGDSAFRTGRIASMRVGESLLGRILDALGEPLDGGEKPADTVSSAVEQEAPPLLWRDFISEPLFTGIKVIDSMLPIGRGQRELIIGDPSTGKTAIGIDAIINQKNTDVISVYVSIGQKQAGALRAMDDITKYGDPSKTVFILADASTSFGLQFIAPYSATTVAEYFMGRGKDVLIVYDDLTKHADAYRSLSLLLKRPPGREAYPGDIFFIHSRLLERSARLNEHHGGGSITALPIIETQQGRISSYIPTNLISITDGQIYLDTLLYNKGMRPAVDVGRSVSRIGGRAQTEAMKRVAGKLKIDYSRFVEVEVFTKFGAHLEEETTRLLRRGERLRELLKQPQFHPISLAGEVFTFIVLESGVLDSVEIKDVGPVLQNILKKMEDEFADLAGVVNREGRLSEKDMEMMLKFASGAKEEDAVLH